MQTILPVIAAVAVDSSSTSMAAAPWVEQVVGALVLSILGLLGWLGRGAIRKIADDATAKEQAKQVEDRRVELAASVDRLKTALETQKSNCTDCHKRVDERLARGDTAIELLRGDMKHVLQAVGEIKGMLLDFLDAERRRLQNGSAVTPLKQQRTNPHMMLPTSEEEGD